VAVQQAVTTAAHPKPAPAVTTAAAEPTAVCPKATPAAPHVAVAAPQAENRTHDSDKAPDPGAGISKLRMELDEAVRSASTKETDLRATLGQRDAHIRELEASAANHDARIKQIQTSSGDQISARDSRIRELETALSARDERIAKLEQEIKAVLSQQGEPGDDLKSIRGIGPAFERELRRLGIRTFAQVAAWTPEDVDTIAPKIKAKPERIRRENWVESAAELAKRSSEST
jgi:predicted flap endonuclease-1-like 5' DNA nuclease